MIVEKTLSAKANMSNRQQELRRFMKQHGLEAMLVAKPESRRYFSGFSGSAGWLLITEEQNLLFTDFRYVEQASRQTDCQILQHTGSAYALLTDTCRQFKLQVIGFEDDFVTYDFHSKIIDSMPELRLVPVQLNNLRMVKDAQEIAAISKAVEIADNAFSQILSFIKPGVSERAIAVELEYVMGRLGAEKIAFDTIVASGKRGALPHGQASEKLIEAGDFITLDFGAVYQGYHSDITRTVCAGTATDRQREIYHTVLRAQQAGVQAAGPGKTGKSVDGIARQLITDAGYGEYFGHGLGHGLGLNIHEEPRLSPQSGEVVLTENMVVTVEPGIYIPDWGGVRIEDTVRISADGCQILTQSSKQLIEISY